MHVMYLFMTVQNKSYIKENIYMCVKARASAEGCIWEKGKRVWWIHKLCQVKVCIYKCECYIRVHLHAYVIEGISIR